MTRRTLPTLAIVLVASSSLVLVAESGAARPRASAASRCNYSVYAPMVHFGMVAHASFNCTSGHPNSSATVVMQWLKHGKWTTVASKVKTLSVKTGAKYTVQVKWDYRSSVDCSAGQDQMVFNLRTHFVLRLNHVRTIDYTTPGQKAFVPCNSTG